MYGIIIELLVCDLQRFIWNMFQNIFFQFGKILQHLLGLALIVADILQIGRDVTGIGKNAFLAHSLNGRYDILLAESEDVCEVINAGFCLAILCFGYVLLGNERLDNAYGILHFILRE